MQKRQQLVSTGGLTAVKAGLIWLIGSVPAANAIEEAKYAVEKQEQQFEVRQYEPQLVAETVVEGRLEAAGNKGFGPLFRYISGDNQSKTKIPMTSPVGQERRVGEEIAMTAPVGQQAGSNGWAVTFMMPSTYTLETLPEPTDPRVKLRAIPASRMAVIRYSGRWSQRGYDTNLARLRDWMKTQGLEPAGEPMWARYNPPFTPSFLRRNEVLIPLAAE